ncbi:MAG TPA: hypothetical protein VNX68_15030 [Nitrosopumilaceae archaeon]|jgi:hypothetical protein|nr:hypothetical protein [Nitrosopumilaceae archaeon]
MTTEELRLKLNSEFGINPWPETYEVDSDTYAHVCQFVFHQHIHAYTNGRFKQITITVGKNNGILFKNVELLLNII